MRAAIYTRFSSDRQSELSTQAQVRACREYAESNGIEIVHIYSDEAISGTEEKTDSRLQYQTLLEDAKKKAFDMILIHKHDRIARSLEEHVRLAAFLRKEQIPLVAVAPSRSCGFFQIITARIFLKKHKKDIGRQLSRRFIMGVCLPSAIMWLISAM